MLDLNQTTKPEYEPPPSFKTIRPTFMADVNNDGTTTKPSLYQRISNSQRFQMFCRIFQLLSSIIASIVFAIRFAKIANDINRATTASNDAVLGILVGAVVYDISSMIGKHFLKNGGPNALRVFWVIADIAFVIGFIMVAELTSPGRGMTSGPCHTLRGINISFQEFCINCDLPIGTFVMAIVNTILHAVTAIFNPIWTLYKRRKNKPDSDAATAGQSELQA